jgi:tetratricopeptide (TPR) repeat protein
LVHNERLAGSSRVRQREIHRFTSSSELGGVLAPGEWAGWTRAIAWREEGIEFDWPAIRERLREEFEAWSAAPSGAKHRRNQKIERLASELVVELAPLSLAKASDAALVESARPSLVALRDSIARLLPSDRHARDVQATKEIHMTNLTPSQLDSADDIFDEGMEHWWDGDRRSALKVFRRALEIDPRHADAHNHLGIASLDARKLKVAEQHFRAAIDGGERRVERDGAHVPWGMIENRPYLRALANLALVLAEQRRWPEALAIHKQMLRLNPDDNQGVRWLIGVEHLRVGDDRGAIEAFRKCAGEEVSCAFGLALARLRAFGPTADIGEPLLTGMAANRYMAPMLLGEPWERLDAFHGTNMAEPEWAADVVGAQADLWHAVPRGADLLRFWWSAPPVVAWRRKLDEVMVRLKDMPVSDQRSAVVGEGFAMRAEPAVQALVRAVRALS